MSLYIQLYQLSWYFTMLVRTFGLHIDSLTCPPFHTHTQNMKHTPTCVGAVLKRSAELSVSRRGASAHVKHVQGQRSQIFNIGVSRCRLDDAITPLILILRFINKDKAEGQRKVTGQRAGGRMSQNYLNSNNKNITSCLFRNKNSCQQRDNVLILMTV